jgi:signal transduction histidine kinase/ligand-binding sensor domain-containing protein
MKSTPPRLACADFYPYQNDHVSTLRPILGLFIAALLLGGLPAATGAAPDSPDYFVRSWKTENGLPDNAVTAVVQTRDGYLWLGTYGGLVRFDGVNFTVFNSANSPELQSDRITSLYEDAGGVLWIGHERGDLTSYQNGVFTAQPAHESGVRRKISAIGADETGDIWMLNEEGTLVRARDGATCALPNQDGVVLMAQSPHGKLWIGSGGQVASLEHGKLVPFTNTVNRYIMGLCASRDGGAWIVADGRVRKWNGRQWTDDRGTNPCSSAVTAMVETKSGCLAMGTVDSGLTLLFPDQRIRRFNRLTGFPHDWIRCLYEDREGTLWAGAGSGGIVALRPSKVETLNPPDNWQNRVALSTTVARDGAIWVGTEGSGLYRFLNDDWKQYGASAGLSNLFVWCTAEDQAGRMWAGTWGGGIFRQNGGHFDPVPGLQNVLAPTAAIFHAPDGVTWIGTASGLIRYENGAAKWFGEKDGLKVPDVRTIAEGPDGTVWFGMLGGGLGRLQAGRLTQYLRKDGLPSDYIQCLKFDAEGTLWIGTYGSGLARFKDGHFTKVTTGEGLPNNFISGIEDDGSGNFWISSHAGVFRVGQVSLNNCADGRTNQVECLTYGRGDGMLSIECSGGLQPASAHTADGRLLFPTSRGVTIINPANLRVNHLPPQVVIEEITSSGRSVVENPGAHEKIKIQPGGQRFEFQYAGLSFVAPEKMRFQYRLEGLENDWLDAGAKRTVDYSYLPPGNYTFHVRAANSDGIWNDVGATCSFEVLPHFWQTIWFHALEGISGAGLVAGVVLFITRRRMRVKLERIERQQAIERERTRIAKDIHDHLGANLTRISLLSQSAHGELQNQTQAAVQLDRIYDTSRELTRALDEIVWAVNPHHDTLDSLASYLGNFAQDYLVSLNIRCRLEVPLHLPQWPLTAEVRHDIFLAFKEAIHNVVKHSGATEVSVFLATGTDDFTLVIRDNGCGFNPAALPERVGRGNGLKNMRQRLEKIGGGCEINSTPGHGTEIKFSVFIRDKVQVA